MMKKYRYLPKVKMFLSGCVLAILCVYHTKMPVLFAMARHHAPLIQRYEYQQLQALVKRYPDDNQLFLRYYALALQEQKPLSAEEVERFQSLISEIIASQ